MKRSCLTATFQLHIFITNSIYNKIILVVASSEIKDEMINEAFGKEESKPENEGEDKDEQPEVRPLSRGEILKAVMAKLGLSDNDLKKTDVRLHETDDSAIFSVTVETKNHDVYNLVVEAYSGTVLKAEFNGAALEIGIEAAE